MLHHSYIFFNNKIKGNIAEQEKPSKNIENEVGRLVNVLL